MDFTGARREPPSETHSYYFREIARLLLEQVHPSHRDPLRSEIISAWRAAGYHLAEHLLPHGEKRFPEELNSLLLGLRQRLGEYEIEALSPTDVMPETWDVEACERLESRAQKFLRLATHEGTPIDEARAAALGLAKMIANSELSLLGWDRVRHFSQQFARMKDAFELIQQENPLMFLYGARDQNH